MPEPLSSRRPALPVPVHPPGAPGAPGTSRGSGVSESGDPGGRHGRGGRPVSGRVAAQPPGGPPRRAHLARPLVLLLAALTVGIHVVVNVVSPYGLHRDEFLYLAMGRHLQLWRMDFPPLIALVAEASHGLFGDRVAGIRMGPALAHGALVALAAMLAREMRGRTGAQALAAVAVLVSPLFLHAGNLLQPVILDQLWWTLGLLALVRLGQDDAVEGADPLRTTGAHAVPAAHGARELRPRVSGEVAEVWPADEEDWAERRGRRRRTDPFTSTLERLDAWGARRTTRDWLLLGLAGGLGLLTKFSILFFGAAVLVALAVGPLRGRLLGGGPWLALLLALTLGAPSVVGQLRLGWPVLGQLGDLQSTQLARVGALDFLGGQLLLGPALLLALLGLWATLRARALRVARTAGLACLAAFLLLLALRGKAYYIGPIYPFLFAAGAAALERGLALPAAFAHPDDARTRLRLTLALVVAFGVVTLPFGLPVVPPAPMARYAATLGIASTTTTNMGEQLALPQDYADMLGWSQLASAVARGWDTIPPEARADAAILASNYGQAGAIDYYAPRLDLPGAVSPAGSYWFFGPGDRAGDPLLTVGVPLAELAGRCGRVVPLPPVRHVETRWLVPEERDVPLALCERPVRSLAELWPELAGRN